MSSEEEDAALYDAVFHNKKEIANLLLSKKLKENSEEPLIHIAVQKRNLHVLKILLQRGTDINEKHNDKTPIEIAIINEFPDIVEFLIQNGADLHIPTKISLDKYNDGYTFLHKAVEIGNTQIIKLLLKSGVDINPKPKPGIYPDICYEKIDENYKVDTACYYFMLLDPFNYVFRRTLTPLEVAILCYPNKGNTVLDLLLKNGAAVENESENVFPIHLAIIWSQDLSQIDKLLEYGAKVNSVCDNLKYTALSHAILLEKTKTVSYLLEKGATFNKYAINSVLHEVIANPFERDSSEKYLTLLIDSGANINSRNGSSKTALHLQISKEYVFTNYLRLLIDYGSGLNAQDLEGNTPLHWAIKKKNYLAAEILILYDADIFVSNVKGNSPLTTLILDQKVSLDFIKSRIISCENIKSYNFLRGRSISRENTAFLMIQATILKEITGRDVPEKDLNMIKNNFRIIYGFLKKKLKDMKLKEVQTNFSYYDILTKSVQTLTTSLNETTIQNLKASDIDKEFPIYAQMLKMRLQRIKERRILIKFCKEHFKSLFGLENELPAVVRENICAYLSSLDLVNLWRIFKKKGEFLSKLLVRPSE